jgi:hypothetical protein
VAVGVGVGVIVGVAVGVGVAVAVDVGVIVGEDVGVAVGNGWGVCAAPQALRSMSPRPKRIKRFNNLSSCVLLKRIVTSRRN